MLNALFGATSHSSIFIKCRDKTAAKQCPGLLLFAFCFFISYPEAKLQS